LILLGANQFSSEKASDIGIDWQSGQRQMIVVGDGSYIPTYIHNLPVQIGDGQITVPVGFSERLGDHARKVTFQPIATSTV
jgi:hypothetical protein